MSDITSPTEAPCGNAAGLKKYWLKDLTAGLLVSLIALPLCLGISNASGFPAISGVFTAIAGGMLCVLLSNSELTIKGPAAGLISIVVGAVDAFATDAGVARDNLNPEVYLQYLPHVAAVAMVSGVLQILTGLFKGGKLANLFPPSVIHGLLAAIGFIIIGKQLYPLLGLTAPGEPEAYLAYAHLPQHLPHLAMPVAIIGLLSLGLLFLYPVLKTKFKLCKIVPVQLIILAIAIPAAATMYRSYDGLKREYQVAGEEQPTQVKALLVKVPPSAAALPNAFIYPDFSKIDKPIFWTWVMMFFLVGTLESMLSAKAVDVLDPYKRRSDLNRDILAVGVANTAVAAIGGLPMISEIVRSSANKDYEAKTRWSNFFHGAFLLLSILLLPALINQIPLTALAAMLIYAGCRLASYRQFIHMNRIGREQLVVFCATIIGILATDLLVGVGIGIAVKLLLEFTMGVNLKDFFRVPTTTTDEGNRQVIKVQGSAVFTNWLQLRKKIVRCPGDHVAIDLSESNYVDHTVMTQLRELKDELKSLKQRELTVIGLQNHRALGVHELAARRLASHLQ